VNQNGFTAAGPVYVYSSSYIETCVKNKIPIVITIDLRNLVDFLKAKDFTYVNKTQVKFEVKFQVQKFLSLNPIVAGWYILPDELRTWRENEMDFLKTVTDILKSYSDMPIISYSPNNRDSLSLKTLCENGVNYIAKQAYVKFNQNQNRTVIRYAVKTATDAYEMLKRENKTSKNTLVGTYLMLADDPLSPSDDCLIPKLSRHDVFLACAHGAKFLIIWSLFKRITVYRTYYIQYYGYVNAINEINKSILYFKNETFSLADILLNSNRILKFENLYHTHVEYEIASNIKLVLDINSANRSMTFKNTKLDNFEVKYEIVEKTSDFK
jgi:hypothetical protein